MQRLNDWASNVDTKTLASAQVKEKLVMEIYTYSNVYCLITVEQANAVPNSNNDRIVEDP